MSIKNVFDMVRMVTDSIRGDSKVLSIFDRSKRKSIRQMAGESILHFPVITSGSVSLEDARLVSSSLEAEYAVLFMLSMEMGQDVIDISKGNSRSDFIGKYHTNIYDKASGKEIFDSIDDMIKEAVFNKVDKSTIESMTESSVMLLEPISEDLEESIVNDKYIVNGFRFMKENSDKQSTVKAPKVEVNKIDHKKINTLPPLVLDIKVFYRNGNSGPLIESNIKVGIKSIMHSIPSDEFHYFISDSLKEENIVFRALQFTTGEIRFFRDFILNLGKIKRQSSINSNNRTVSKWWHKLSQLSKVNKITSFFGKNKFLPSTTMVLSYEDTQTIKSRYGVDIMDPSNAKKLSDIYFLLGLVIVDNASDSYHFFNDLTMSYDVVTSSEISTVSKSKDNNDMDTLIKLIAGRR